MADSLEKQELVSAVASSGSEILARAQEKLNRKSLDVEVPVNLTVVETLEASLAELKNNEADRTHREEAERQIESLKADTIVGTLVPLKATDLLLVQGWVTEAAIKGRELGFDLDVQLFLMSKAERCGTVYLSLRKRQDPGERYFRSQEDVVLLDDRVLRQLATLYSEHFVLTEEERKNLQGAPRS